MIFGINASYVIEKFLRDFLTLFLATAAAQGAINGTAPDWHALWIAGAGCLGPALYRVVRDLKGVARSTP